MYAQILNFEPVKVPTFESLLRDAMEAAFEGDDVKRKLACVQIYDIYPDKYNFVFHKCQRILEARREMLKAGESEI